GGLGALGLQVADWLAERGAGHVALMSRRSPDEAKQQSMQALESKGIRVAAVQCDVTTMESLETAINQIPGDFGPLKGVIHAAGVLADGVMFDMDLEQLDKPLGSKVQGTWNLHQATKDKDLDCFVLFSSIASVLGSPGQSNYAAGNAYLDGMAAMRQSNGLPGVSINWGPWANSGMATEEGREEQLASRGMGMLPAEESLNLMGDLIAQNRPATAVMAVNWVNLVRASGGNVAPLLTDVAADVEVGSRGDSAEDRAFRKMIGDMSVPERNEKLSEFFAGQLARIMGMELEDIEVATPLNAMGLDSLMAIELKNKIESQLQMSLPMAVFMNEPSVATIAEYVAENFGKDPSDSESNGQVS
ncbi:MAG: beta-ketoacyl reductase, partial [Planctomycetota bacterium]